jgi:hypothetical protein
LKESLQASRKVFRLVNIRLAQFGGPSLPLVVIDNILEYISLPLVVIGKVVTIHQNSSKILNEEDGINELKSVEIADNQKVNMYLKIVKEY